MPYQFGSAHVERDRYPERDPVPYGRPSNRFQEIRRRGVAPVRTYPVTRQQLREEAPGRTGGLGSTRHPTADSTRTPLSGGRRDGYRGAGQSTRYRGTGAPPRDWEPYRQGTEGTRESVRPGMSGFYSSIPSPFANSATNPPVILDRVDRQLSGPAVGGRRSRQLAVGGARHGDRHGGQLRSAGGRTEEVPERRERRADGDSETDSSWQTLLTAGAGSDESGLLGGGQHQPGNVRGSSSVRGKPLPFTGKIFEAHLRSGPITFVTDDASGSHPVEAHKEVNEENSVSRKVDEAAMIIN